MPSDIKNREQMQQINDFSGLRWESITPTDVDGMVEFGGRLFVFMEGKYGTARIGDGQRLALMRCAAAIHLPPKRYAAIIRGRHNIPPAQDVDFANIDAVQYWWPGENPTRVSAQYSIDIKLLDRYWIKSENCNIRDVIDYLRKETGIQRDS